MAAAVAEAIAEETDEESVALILYKGPQRAAARMAVGVTERFVIAINGVASKNRGIN
ncbi:MAG: hypothetical protein Q9212_007329 [Teloschistes hypoglaucus]